MITGSAASLSLMELLCTDVSLSPYYSLLFYRSTVHFQLILIGKCFQLETLDLLPAQLTAHTIENKNLLATFSSVNLKSKDMAVCSVL